MATVLMYIILAIYAVDGFILVISDQTKSISKLVKPIDLDTNPGFIPG
jgi:hypothetical protein